MTVGRNSGRERVLKLQRWKCTKSHGVFQVYKLAMKKENDENTHTHTEDSVRFGRIQKLKRESQAALMDWQCLHWTPCSANSTAISRETNSRQRIAANSKQRIGDSVREIPIEISHWETWRANRGAKMSTAKFNQISMLSGALWLGSPKKPGIFQPKKK